MINFFCISFFQQKDAQMIKNFTLGILLTMYI